MIGQGIEIPTRAIENDSGVSESMWVQLVAVFCVLGIVVGQLLFKMGANAWASSGSFFALKTLTVLAAAMTLYGLTSLAWVWVLQKADLGKVYPYMALAFILVPLGSYLLFTEKFQPQYLFGVILIATGILLTMRS